MSTNDPTLQVNDVIEVRRVLPAPNAVVGKEQAVIKILGCDKIVLKTTYAGPPGPKGDTAEFDDLEIPSLALRFQSRLV
jgi:hypothetical protein